MMNRRYVVLLELAVILLFGPNPVAIAVSSRKNSSESHQQSPTERPEIPDLNELPPIPVESSQHYEGHHSAEGTTLASEAQFDRLSTTKPKKKKQLRYPTVMRKYATLTEEEKKAYSRYQTSRHRERFNSWVSI